MNMKFKKILQIGVILIAGSVIWSSCEKSETKSTVEEDCAKKQDTTVVIDGLTYLKTYYYNAKTDTCEENLTLMEPPAKDTVVMNDLRDGFAPSLAELQKLKDDGYKVYFGFDIETRGAPPLAFKMLLDTLTHYTNIIYKDKKLIEGVKPGYLLVTPKILEYPEIVDGLAAFGLILTDDENVLGSKSAVIGKGKEQSGKVKKTAAMLNGNKSKNLATALKDNKNKSLATRTTRYRMPVRA